MAGGILVCMPIHYHRCSRCVGDFQCQCECPESVIEFVCEECEGGI